MNFEYQELHDELVALDAQIDELSRPIVEPPPPPRDLQDYSMRKLPFAWPSSGGK